MSVLGINHFDVYGGHFKKWQPFPWVMLFIAATNAKRDATTILIYSCIFENCWTEKKTSTVRTKSVCTHAGGVCLKMEDLALSIIVLFRNFEM